MAENQTFKHGPVPTSTIEANIEYGTHVEESKFGLVGIKVSEMCAMILYNTDRIIGVDTFPATGNDYDRR